MNANNVVRRLNTGQFKKNPKVPGLSSVLPFLLLLLTIITPIGIRCVAAQSILDGGTPTGVAPGSPAGSYALSDIENINLFSGNLNFVMPLRRIEGRGGAQSTMMLTIESHWTNFRFFRNVDGSYMNAVPMYNFDALGIDSNPGYGPGFLVQRMRRVDDRNIPNVFYGITHLVFTRPDGTQIELQDTLTGGAPQVDYAGIPPNSYAAPRGTTFVSIDGTATTFVSDNVISDQYTESTSVYGNLMMRDGTRYRIDDGLVTSITDRNGNQLTFTYTNRKVTLITDSLGRQTTVEYGVNDVAPYGVCDRIKFNGSGGQLRTIRISHDLLSNSLAGGFTLKTKTQLFPPLSPDYVTDQNNINNFDTTVVSSVWLPDDGITTRRYKFYYDSYAELARVELPTGGAYEYDWRHSVEPFSNGYYSEILRQVKERRVINQGITVQKSTYTYSYPAVTVDTYGFSQSAAHLIRRERHFFYGGPMPDPWVDSSSNIYSEDSWNNGKEYQTDLLASDGTTTLRSVSRVWRQRAPVGWWTSPGPGIPSCGTGCIQANAPPNDPRIVETVTTLSDTDQVSKVTSIDPSDASGQTVAMDQFNDPTDVWEYDYGTGAPGAFLRRTHTDYLTDVSYISEGGANLRGLPIQTWISSDIFGNNKSSRTQFEYDNYSSSSNHAPLISPNNVVGFDYVNFGTSNPVRGNVTSVTSYADAQSQTGAVTFYSEYDIIGNVVKTTDANGNASTIGYNDNFGAADGESTSNTAPSQLNGFSTYAFPTSRTDPSNSTAFVQYDYFTGGLVNSQDSNGMISKVLYEDPLDRPTQSFRAVGTALEGQTSTIYDDLNHRIETTEDLKGHNDNLLKSERFYDGLGKTIETRKYEADGGYVSTQTVPFETIQDPVTTQWRASSKISNPYRPLRNEIPVWSTSVVDELGRRINVAAPDDALIKIDYSGNVTTVTDQDGKLRRSIANALGQLIRVDEPNSGGSLGTLSSPNQPTYYTYDALNNLLTVSQSGSGEEQCGPSGGTCSQTRVFTYDSLSRLLSVRNPESGTSSYLYDSNGNLTRKTDARGVQTDYVYDALNRVTNRNYSTPGGTPSNYQASLNVTYTYGTIAPAIGKLTKVSTGTGAGSSTTEYTSFDILGRVTGAKQTTDGGDPNGYATGYTYTLGGSLDTETYPSARVVKNELNNDGSLSLVESKKDANHGYWDYANSFTYNPAGAVTSMQLGNGHWESTVFNTRLQPTQIALGTVPNGTDKLKLNYDYGSTANNGNVQSQTITVPTVGTSTGFVAVQSYSYDSLNRLKDATENVTATGGSASQSWKQTFSYDRYGNRNFDEANTTTLPRNCGTSPNFLVCTADKKIVDPSVDVSNNRLSTSDGYSFDSAGNTIADAQSRTFIYDGENKQVEVKDGSNNVIGDYFYDGDGKRVKKYVPATGETTVFVYDAAGKEIAEYSTIVANSTDAKVNYLTSDHLGSPRINTDANGAVISRHDYMVFGEPIDGVGGRTIGLNYGDDHVRKKFTGYERDGEIDLDFAQARFFESSKGRFVTVDPYNVVFDKNRGRDSYERSLILFKFLSQPQKWDKYVYVMNGPTRYIDPAGLIYLEANGYVYYVDDDYYDKNKDAIKKEIGNYKVVPIGSIISVGNDATGIFAPFKNKKVVLGDKGNLLEITDYDIQLGTVHSSEDPDLESMSASPSSDSTFDNFWSSPFDEAYKQQHLYLPHGGLPDKGFGGDPYGGGYRHCVASCILMKRYGSFGDMARRTWDWKNENGIGDSITDMQGEDIGEFFGRTSEGSATCAIMCANAYPPGDGH